MDVLIELIQQYGIGVAVLLALVAVLLSRADSSGRASRALSDMAVTQSRRADQVEDERYALMTRRVAVLEDNLRLKEQLGKALDQAAQNAARLALLEAELGEARLASARVSVLEGRVSELSAQVAQLEVALAAADGARQALVAENAALRAQLGQPVAG